MDAASHSSDRTPAEALRLPFERIAVVGLGYVGLPASVAFARAGFTVTGADVDTRVVRALRDGRSPLAEAVPDADVAALVRDGRLDATDATHEAVASADFVVVCVPTPVEGRRPDLKPLRSASRAIGRGLRRGTVVSYESTTFPGCTERVCIPLLEEESGLSAGRDFGVAYCPERVVPGDESHVTTSMPRVLGALDDRSYERAHFAYSRAIRAPIARARDLRTAEASKVFENVQRDVNIALVNEFALLAPKLGLDVHEVLAAARTKFNFVDVRPGPGVGGHCIPVDPWYLVEEARLHGFEPRLMALARDVNDGAMDAFARAVLRALASPARSKVAILGLAYKGGVGDLRESPAVHVAGLLRSEVAVLAAHDPRAEAARAAKILGFEPTSLEEAVKGAHAIAVATDHPEFRSIPWGQVANLAAPGAVVLDARDVVDEGAVRAAGLRAWRLGRDST